MAIPGNKQELEIAIRSAYQKLRAELASVPEALARDKDLDGHAKGTKMSVCDLVAYLIGWGELVLKWHDKKQRGQHFDLPETGYKWNELGRLAQKFYADHQHDTFPALLNRYDMVVASLLALIATKTNDQLYTETWYEQWPLGRLIQFNTSAPYLNARARLRKWQKERQRSSVS